MKEDLVIQVAFDGFESLRDTRCPASAGGGGQFLQVFGPAKPPQVGAETTLLKKGPEAHGCTNLVLNGTSGIRAWAGLVEDPFVVDIGQFNRILGGSQDAFRDVVTPLGELHGRPIRVDGTSGVDSFGGFNASGLAVEVPIALLQSTASRTNTYPGNSGSSSSFLRSFQRRMLR